VSETNDVRCADVVELITDYLEGALPSEQRARVEAHLAGCDGCSTVLDQFRQTIRLTGKLREDQLTEPQRSTLLHAFRNWSSGTLFA
jgi:anti-sigma factor RsiW